MMFFSLFFFLFLASSPPAAFAAARAGGSGQTTTSLQTAKTKGQETTKPLVEAKKTKALPAAATQPAKNHRLTAAGNKKQTAKGVAANKTLQEEPASNRKEDDFAERKTARGAAKTAEAAAKAEEAPATAAESGQEAITKAAGANSADSAKKRSAAAKREQERQQAAADSEAVVPLPAKKRQALPDSGGGIARGQSIRKPSNKTAAASPPPPFQCLDYFESKFEAGHIEFQIAGSSCQGKTICFSFSEIMRNRCESNRLIRYYCDSSSRTAYSSQVLPCENGCEPGSGKCRRETKS